MPYAADRRRYPAVLRADRAQDAPVILQFGGGLFGRHNFGLVNDGFRERFRLLSFDARGYGASSNPREEYTIEGWAADGAALLDAVGLERAFIHGTSMGGMIAIAFAALYPEPTIAACADVAFAKPDVYRRTLFRVWRRMAESMPWDDFSDHVDDAGGRGEVHGEPRGREHLRAGAQHCRAQRSVHGAPGLSRHGEAGPVAARPEDRAAAPDDERHARRALPARAGAVGPRRAADGGAEPERDGGRVPRHRPRRPRRVPRRRGADRERVLRARRGARYEGGLPRLPGRRGA